MGNPGVGIIKYLVAEICRDKDSIYIELAESCESSVSADHQELST